ncbi:MAG TPA: hypothetical protein VNA21_10605 [Steroidobacteraceae bacterium]|nr:hypothetical protein [Steroidobacteraceae bacterium]
MPDLQPILLVEDKPKDIELTLAALAKCQLANDIVVTRDGADALDYIYMRSEVPAIPRWSCSISNCSR